jgi:hypothetical protein
VEADEKMARKQKEQQRCSKKKTKKEKEFTGTSMLDLKALLLKSMKNKKTAKKKNKNNR